MSVHHETLRNTDQRTSIYHEKQEGSKFNTNRFHWVSPDGEKMRIRDWVQAEHRMRAFKVIYSNYEGATDLEHLGESMDVSAASRQGATASTRTS
jgi:hypothetical protein